jgi:hypothetical protein
MKKLLTPIVKINYNNRCKEGVAYNGSPKYENKKRGKRYEKTTKA